MPNRLKLVAVALLAGVLSLAFAQETPVVGLVMKSLANEFFQDMEAGAIAHVEERGDLELINLGIQSETDLEAQIALVENLIVRNVDAIVIAPADSRALLPPLVRAIREGIVVVNIDVMLDQDAMAEAGVDIPFVGPDNEAAAKEVGDVMVEHLGPGGKVIILEGISGAENAIQRAAGFRRAAEEGGLEIVASRSANWETDQAFQLTSDLITANPGIEGVMASNDSMAIGAVRALDAQGRQDIVVVGFDNLDAVHPLIREGRMLATLDQFGALQAAFGIDIAMDMIAGAEYSGWVQTDIQLITESDLD